MIRGGLMSRWGHRERQGSEVLPRRSAERQVSARWSDARLWASVILVVIATALGAILLGRGGDTVLVLRADRDLAAGATLNATSTVAVPRALADSYVTSGGGAQGVLQWPVAAGDLVPRAAIVVESTEPVRGVTIPVDPLHAPADLTAGDLVDVWATPATVGGVTVTDPGGPAAAPTLVLSRVPVTAVSTEGVGFGGGWGVELAVPEDDVARAVAAGRTSVIDLVAVPATSVAPAPVAAAGRVPSPEPQVQS